MAWVFLLASCVIPGGAATPALPAPVPQAQVSGGEGPALTATFTPLLPTPSPTPEATATPNAEATKQAEFEAKKAEALKMVSIKLDSPEDFATLPVLDSKKFDNGEVQAEMYWLMDNVLPPAPENLKLPDSWRVNGQNFRTLSYNHITEADIIPYRFAGAFFVMQDGVKMLRIGLQFGGKDQLIFINLEDPRWWTEPSYVQFLIDGIDFQNYSFLLIDNFGPDMYKTEIYTRKITAERLAGGDQLVQYWIKNRELPQGADRTVFGTFGFALAK